jgi:chromosome segregation ATPase
LDLENEKLIQTIENQQKELEQMHKKEEIKLRDSKNQEIKEQKKKVVQQSKDNRELQKELNDAKWKLKRTQQELKYHLAEQGYSFKKVAPQIGTLIFGGTGGYLTSRINQSQMQGIVGIVFLAISTALFVYSVKQSGQKRSYDYRLFQPYTPQNDSLDSISDGSDSQLSFDN